MDRRLIETLKRNTKELRGGGEFIDAYNLSINDSGVAGVIYSRINLCNHIYVTDMNTKVIGMLDLEGRHESALRVHDINYISPTINTMTGGGLEPKIMKDLRIRKLTPRECWRLMDFTDKDFDKAAKVNSDSRLYMQAGNSIVVRVLEEIFKQMLKE